MNHLLKKVEDFHKVFGHPHSLEPTMPKDIVLNFRLKFLLEELSELVDATGTDKIWLNLLSVEHDKIATKISNGDIKYPNWILILDALCDIEYVFQGMILSFGLDMIFDEAFAHVHASNMTKAFGSQVDAKIFVAENVDKYEGGLTITSFMIGHDELFIIKDALGKVIKNPKYNKVDDWYMKQLIERSKRPIPHPERKEGV